MKKSLLVLAVLGTIAGAAAAQSSLSIYGLVDAGLVEDSGGPNGDTWRISSGVQNGSRIGFRGTEDLGRNLQAKFVLEAGINIDTGTTGQSTPAVPPGSPGFSAQPATNRLFGRQAYVGLSGNWGNVTFGRQYTPHYLAVAEIDPFGAGLAGDAANFIPTIQRMDNTVKYTSPTWLGFTADLAYGFGEVQGEFQQRQQYGVSLGYANGPLTVKAVWHQANGDIPEAAFPALPPGTVSGIPRDEKARTWLVGGKWDFGVAALHLAFNNTKAGRTLAEDTKDWLIGVSAPVGPVTILASYINKDDGSNFNAGASQWAIGLTYPVSKRTNFYTSFAKVDNDRDTIYTAGNATERGTGDKQFNIGVRHLF